MRLFLLTLVLLSAGCTRSAGEPAPDLLGTSVAATLTVHAKSLPPTDTETSVPSPEPSATATGLPDEQATQTAKETASAQLTEAAPTPEPTTPTPPPSPTPADSTGLGLDPASPDYHDDFSVRGTFFEYSEPDTATFLWEDGRLMGTDNATDAFLWWSTTDVLVQDRYMELAVEVGDCAGKDAYGLTARVDTESFDAGYTLEFSCDGSFRMRKFISGEAPIHLITWTESEHIHPGPNVVNVIGLLADDAELTPYANGAALLAGPLTDSDYSSGYFSVFPSAAHTSGLTVYFDDFKLWSLP